MAPVNELRLPSRMGARVCARMPGAARLDASATPAPAVPAMNLRRDIRRAVALAVVIVCSLAAMLVVATFVYARSLGRQRHIRKVAPRARALALAICVQRFDG